MRQHIIGRLAVLAAASAAALPAMAVEPGEAVFTAAGVSVATYGAAGFVLLTAVLAFSIGMKLVKKFIGKAT